MYMLYMNKYTFITSFAQFNLFIIFTLQENDNHHCNANKINSNTVKGNM